MVLIIPAKEKQAREDFEKVLQGKNVQDDHRKGVEI